MKASLNWLKELLPELAETPQQIEQKLTDVGIEVEEIEYQASALENVVTAEVTDLEPHPNADRLRLATVFDGSDSHKVVCGAPNIEKGQKIIFAKLGASLPIGLTIEPRKIRGVQSSGMVCSEAELGLSEESDGIMVLEKDIEPGIQASKALSRDDIIYELGVTPNRPDVLSHLGVARELAATFNYKLPTPFVELPSGTGNAADSAKISIQWPERCSRYIGRVLKGVKVGPSPEWVVRRLQAVGQRSVSNVVDATNLVLLETGHPLHAFDLNRLTGSEIIVRAASAGEKMTTLDGAERTLTEDDLVIADAKVPVALAGVMGGADSEVTEETVDILLEAAMFYAPGIRRSSKRHGLHTEASHRFERGADALALEYAIDRCAQLVLEMAGGELAAGAIDVVEQEFEPVQAYIRPERAARLLGRAVDGEEVTDVLTRLGLQQLQAYEDLSEKHRERLGAYAKQSNAMLFQAPSWRVDLAREEDLIEEVARISGYEKIPTLMPSLPTTVWTHAPAKDWSTEARQTMVGLGYYETISLAFNSAKQLDAVGVDHSSAVRLTNPLGEESAFMRTSLLPAQLRSAKLNQSLMRTDLRLFEIGRTFEWGADDSADLQGKGRLPEETLRLSVLLRGQRNPQSWSTGSEVSDVFDLKAHLDVLLRSFDIRAYDCVKGKAKILHPKYATDLVVDGQVIGFFGVIHPDVAKAFDLDGPDVLVAELDLGFLSQRKGSFAKFKALPKYPSVARDLSFFVDKTVAVTDIIGAARKAKGQDLLESVELFDVYEGKGLPQGKRSVAIRMTYRSADTTLTDTDVDQALGILEQTLEAQVGAEIRRGN